MIFKLGDGVHPMIKQTLEAQGWIEFDPTKHDENDWNLHWKSSRFSALEFRDVQPWQRLNHFQGSIDITRKDRLCRMVRKMTLHHGKTYNFAPMSFVLPTDLDKFRQDRRTRRGDGGIFLLRRLEDLDFSCSTVIQEYIERPLTINGFKMDMRLYVLVTSFQPLVVYAYRDGIARFGTSEYNLSDLSDLYCHLTNTSINKHNPKTKQQKTTTTTTTTTTSTTTPSSTPSSSSHAAGAGCKWTIGQLRQYFRDNNIDDKRIWRRVSNIFIYTLLCLTGVSVKQQSSCFELYGFDVLLDERLKPWLIEVNFSPALGLDCQQDRDVKIPLIQDIVRALNYEATGTRPTRRRTSRHPSSSKKKKQQQQHSVPVDDLYPYEIGNFVRIFPFNKTTLQESGKQRPNVKAMVSELKRVNKMAREEEQQRTRDNDGGGDNGGDGNERVVQTPHSTTAATTAAEQDVVASTRTATTSVQDKGKKHLTRDNTRGMAQHQHQRQQRYNTALDI
ncbi:hypothetical protein PTSG_02922 [Salpingoeca rosetta]|uniref:Uncharacterized protein n=1 Tax=Salpingoeca rosetta (strain ATCC 50818 / BSB-021) TaxID=946362 RepID=F2U3Q8_SALR5|nr:uncharacterized protein PTSG_02922 [Salpingoeca rosetta]EGD82252.1 hypothetical protein PTSG_02922 [Salpingoeca rosetta]|eukprot:XP_004996435.1 hypothetical protein PTSG_02922 [Salpingoeca rosetta]